MKNAAVTLLLAGCTFFTVRSKWYWKNARATIDDHITGILTKLGDSAINTRDVPVAAIVMYDGNMLGEGYNTVKRDTNAAGHAEINAITNAIRRTGLDSFMHLDRHKLTLISTWDPCLMCKGAIVEYNIPRVIINTPKSLGHSFSEWLKLLGYEWHKQVATTDTLQYYLFRKHPDYHNECEKLP